MSKKRQEAILDLRGTTAAPLKTLSYDYPDGYVVPEHFHKEDQLVFAAKGVMSISTELGLWVVPPLRAVWIPGGEVHSIEMSGGVQLRTLYFSTKYARRLSRKCLVLNVTPLLRELIIYSCRRPEWQARRPAERRIIEFAIDLIEAAKSAPLQLPQPRDKRARRVATQCAADLASSATLGELCKASGASKRTIERLFIDETGMTYGKWRQQLRLLHAMRLLASGEKVLTAAIECGYASPSAFISAFKKAVGQTPSRYFEMT